MARKRKKTPPGFRPLCKFCGRELQTNPEWEWDTKNAGEDRYWGYHGNGVFCKLSCGFYYALRIFKPRKG